MVKARVPLEKTIVAACMRELAARGAWAMKTHGTGFGRAGVPDIIFCLNGRFLAIECKRPGAKTTPMQARELAAIRRAGGIGYVVTDMKILMEVLTKLGF